LADKLQHFALAFVLQVIASFLYDEQGLLLQVLPIASLLLCIEFVQADCWGEVQEIRGFISRQLWWFSRRDTWFDLLADALGIVPGIFLLETLV